MAKGNYGPWGFFYALARKAGHGHKAASTLATKADTIRRNEGAERGTRGHFQRASKSAKK